MPSSRSSIAAASPDGPPPTITGPSSIAIFALQQALYLGPAEEPLATAHQSTRPSPQAVRVDRRDRAPQRRIDLAAGDAFAEADDPPVVRIARDAVPVLIRARIELPDVGHPQFAALRRGAELESRVGKRLADPLRDRQRGG